MHAYPRCHSNQLRYLQGMQRLARWLVALAALAAFAPAQERPNFVFVIVDDVSPRDLGAYGNDDVSTPHLDAMAERGLVFDNAYLTISSCSPSARA